MKILYVGVCKDNLERYYPNYLAGDFIELPFTAEALVERVWRDRVEVLMVDVTPIAFSRSLLRQLRGQVKHINFLYQSISSLIDVEDASRCGIRVTKLPNDVYCNEVAEFAVAQMLCASKGILEFDRSMRRGQWNQAATVCRSLVGKTLGVIGYGHIGKRIVELCGNFGMSILATRRNLGIDVEASNVELVMLPTLLERSDFIVLALPLTRNTYHLLNAKNLDRVKDQAVIVNVSRGDLVDEKTVLAALESGRLGGYCADVFASEPLDKQHPFASTARTILTPHVAWMTEETLARSFQLWSSQVRR
jgi:phosphoglycerate dehydrogenase-like enzyme